MMELANEAHRFPTMEKFNHNFIEYFSKQMDKREENSKISWSYTHKHLLNWWGDKVPFGEIDNELIS